MKRYLPLALVGIVASAATLLAIPDRVGVLLIGTNARVEDFALSLDSWNKKTFSSEWEDASVEDTDEETSRLKRAYVVFGVQADQVDAVRRNGDLQRFLITYQPGTKSKTTPDGIVGKLRRNIEAYTGEDLVESAADATTAAGYRCRYKEFEIYLGKRRPNQVLVAIRRIVTTT